MLDGVGDRLAHDEVSGRFDLRRKPLAGGLQLNRDGRGTREVGKGRREPFVQPRRSHSGGDRAQILDRPSDLVYRGVECRPENPCFARKRPLQPTQDDPERHEPLLCPVVEIALEPSALFVARPDDTGSRILHLGKL